ncbi:hypothetical protein K4M64_004538 [Salmonella enterica]|nr:hypothetical protein [Salmonella enterica]
MSLFDVVNNNSEDYQLGTDYNPTQSNVLGQPLAPINSQGQLSAVDPINDTRTSQDFKSDANDVSRIARSYQDEDEDSYISENGNKYQKVNNSNFHQGMLAAGEYIASWFMTNGDVGASAMAAGKAVYDNDAKADRLSQVNALEREGLNPIDIQNFINSGDKKDLIVNKGKWINVGNGQIANDLTGEIKSAPNQNVAPKSIDLGDRKRLYYPDGTVEDVPKGVTPGKYQVAGAGIDQDEAQATGPQISEDGRYYWKTSAKGGGNWEPIPAGQQKQHVTEEEKNTQIQAVATQGAETAGAGNDILNFKSGLALAGPSMGNEVKRFTNEKFGSNDFNQLKSLTDTYNHKLTTLGQANLYIEAGNKRIFAEEMKSAGENFMMLDPEKMNAQQLADAITHNNDVISRVQQIAQRSATGQRRANANETVYGQSFASPAPQYNNNNNQPQGKKDFSHMW